MLGYISSTRKKSCTACVKAKRRCDLGYPFCKRCFVKGLDCAYPTSRKTPVSVRDAELVIRHTPLDTSQPTAAPTATAAATAATSVEPVSNSGDLHVNAHDLGNTARHPWILAALLPSSLSSSSPESESSEPNNSTLDPEVWSRRDDTMTALLPQLRRTLLPTVVVPVHLNEQQSIAVIEGLCSWVTTMACSGTTPFLHRNLYAEHDQPAAYQDCVAISALYMAQNAVNANILINSINAKISALVKESRNWSLMQHLAAVQALIIYQIIRLFDPTLSAQEQAVKHNMLLEHWTTSLFHRSSYDAPASFADSRERWVFAESLRRTLFMSTFTRCAWSVFSTGGLASQVHVLAGMPLTKDMKRWRQEETQQCGGENMRNQEQGLVSYVDFALDWSHDKSVEELGSFGKLILAPCRGDDDVRLLV